MNIERTLKSTLSLFAGALLAVSSAACGEESTQNAGVTRDDDDAQTGTPNNPYGVAYPTAGVGRTPRSASRAGDKFPNFRFMGYPDGNVEAGLQPISMADFYDPEFRNNVKLIHIQASGTWCTFCRQESKEVSPYLQEFREKGVVYMLSMAEGKSPGSAAVQLDLDSWISTYDFKTVAFLDPGNEQLGGFYDAAAMPWNATIDATTMELLSSSMGQIKIRDMQRQFDGYIKEIDARRAGEAQ